MNSMSPSTPLCRISAGTQWTASLWSTPVTEVLISLTSSPRCSHSLSGRSLISSSIATVSRSSGAVTRCRPSAQACRTKRSSSSIRSTIMSHTTSLPTPAIAAMALTANCLPSGLLACPNFPSVSFAIFIRRSITFLSPSATECRSFTARCRTLTSLSERHLMPTFTALTVSSDFGCTSSSSSSESFAAPFSGLPMSHSTLSVSRAARRVTAWGALAADCSSSYACMSIPPLIPTPCAKLRTFVATTETSTPPVALFMLFWNCSVLTCMNSASSPNTSA
mmetsp:Transcript_11568/g.28053  ORF Transcript_11568/g.28053 Transcript_11568/m.28053 type:complete len:279 (-) Transcript_11568:9-845(-)